MHGLKGVESDRHCVKEGYSLHSLLAEHQVYAGLTLKVFHFVGFLMTLLIKGSFVVFVTLL